MSKLITVFGATGTQGGSVVQAIQADPVLSKEFKIRAVTRDVTKPKAQQLAASGCEVVAGDLSSAETVLPAIQGSHTVFLVTNFWETMSADVEISQGKAVADASKAAGVKHLIASTLANTTEASQGRLTHITHFDSKAKIEQYIRDSGIPATFYQPGFFMSNLFGSFRKGEDGSFTYALPVGGSTTKIPVVDAASDTGVFVAHAIKGFPGTQGQRIYGASKFITPEELMKEFSEVIGKSASFQQIPLDVFKGFLPPAAADEMAENMLLMDDCGYYGGDVDLEAQNAGIEKKPKSWKQFVEENKEKWL